MRIISVEQTADQLGVKTDRVYELCRQGFLPHVRLGRQVRIVEEQLHEWLLKGGQPLACGWRHDPQAKLDEIRKRGSK
ncbi:MAG TPA: helix-turn-helix domain-containing protein [Fimbriimonadaceae bacterium]|nr:helix-turn-helix domain-containing protein [Fimbriimonadaceae bacterium]